MGIQERRGRERDETRAKIMDAARELFACQGFDAVSMRKIAEAIEYSPTAIYVHFQDKDSLFAELCREDFSKLAVVFNELSRVKDPVERLRQIGHNYVRFALEYPNHYRLMFMTARRPAPGEPLPANKGNPDEDAYAFLKATVDEALAGGRFRPEFKNAELVTQTLWATAHGVASLQITKGNDPWVDWRPVEERTRLALDAILRGMLVNPAEFAPARKARKAGVQ